MRIDLGLNDCEYVENNTCELHIRNEYESDLCNNEHYLSGSKNEAWKNWDLCAIWTHDLCDTGAVLYQLS